MTQPPFRALVLAALVIGALGLPARAAERVVEIPVREGATLKLIENLDAGPAAPIVLLMIGGNGVARLEGWNGTGDPNGNFLTRTRALFARAGFVTALPDAPSDRQSQAGLANSRTGRRHAEDIAQVIAHMRKTSNGPVFVVGTSRGTVSAANIAARLPAGAVAGVVLTSSVTRENRRGNRDPVRAAALDRIRAPVLLVHHRQDECYVCVPDDVPELARKFTAAPSVKVEMVEGGHGWRGDPCGAFHAHGFVGIEDKVVDGVAAWINAVAAGAKP